MTETRALPTSLPESVDGLERGRAPGWWGMVLLIVTEALLFSILLVSYVFLRFQLGPDWPAGDIAEPELGLVLVMTPILLSSSAPIHWAERGIRRGKRGRLVGGLLLTIALGATFLSLQAVEYSKTLEEFTPQTNVYGSLFFAITGFHGLHVLVGLLLLAWLVFYAVRGRFTGERHLPVQVITMYWHFVDVVWVFILLTIYLSPHFT